MEIISKNENETAIGKLNVPPHSIRLKDDIPVHSNPYPLTQKYVKEIREEIDRLLSLNLIRKSSSEYCSPAFPVLKRNGKVRIVVDYRKLNEKTITVGYPFPSTFDQFFHLKGSTIFSKLDMNCGFYQIPLSPESVPYTSFGLGSDQYEFLRLPLGLVNAPRTFQRAINDILHSLPFCKIFMDDILIHSSNEDEHFLHCKEVLERIYHNGGTINPSKSEWFRDSLSYLGVQLSSEGIRPDNSHKLSFKNLLPPKTVKQVQKLVGTINWYRSFIPDLSARIAPITSLINKNKGKIIWLPAHEEIINDIRKIINAAPVLSFPDFEKDFFLDSDASGEAIGSVLSQSHGIVA